MTERSESKRRGLLFGFAAVALIIVLAGVYGFGRYVKRYAEQPDAGPSLLSQEGGAALRDIALALPGRLLDPFQSESVPRLHLEIKSKHFKKLEKKRDKALEKQFLISEDGDYVPARLHVGDRSVKVRVRLKGDLTDHLIGEKWSFRVVVRGDDSVLGMERFSVQAPYTRGNQNEPLFLDFLRSQGVLAPRYFFVDLSVNGNDVGRMAVEEHFSTELLEHQQRRDGVILRFDESDFYAAEAAFMDLVPDYDNWRNVPIDAFRSGRINGSPLLRSQFETGAGLVRGLQDGTLEPSAALDVDLWARFLAACEVWSTPHLTHWNNLRMYVNPFTLRLEPIGFDAYGEESDLPALHCMGGGHAMMTALVDDPAVRDAFVARLHEMARMVETEAFERWLRTREERYLSQLHGEYPWLEPISIERMRERASILLRIDAKNFAAHVPRAPERAMPHADGAPYPKVVRATLMRRGNETFVELASAISKPVTVTALYAERFGERRPLAPGSDDGGAVFHQLEGTPWPRPPKRVRIAIALPDVSPDEWTLFGEARVDGRAHPFEIRRGGVAAATGPALPESSLEETLAKHPFLRKESDSSGAWLAALKGTYDVAGSLVLPTGTGLRIAAGTTLRFADGELLLARGPLEFLGNEREPVVIEAQGDRFSGVVALESDAPSVWRHVTVRRTEAASRGAWQLTGAVTFRKAMLTLDDCRFEDSTAEDALNTVRSEVTIRNIVVERSPSDAVDLDFCTGTVTGGVVRDVGGDGLDGAGAALSIADVELERIGDKAVSVGEASEVDVKNVRATDCGTGVASKDGSLTRVADSRFTGVRIAGLMAYTKKAAYGPARLEASNVESSGSGRTAVAQTGSVITIDGAPIRSEDLDVEALYANPEAAQ